jgi:site-specific DNA recombinase
MSNTQTLTQQKCFVYLRRSQDREDRQALSIEKQDTQVKQLLNKNGSLIPIYLPPEERSAKIPGRPIFNDMMSRVESGEVQYIAVWLLSRLSRNPVDGGRVIYALDTGKLLAIYTPNRTYRNTPDDKMVLAIELALAKKNNDDLSVQVKEGFETKRAHGQYPGPAFLGYMNAIIRPGERNIVPDPDKAPKVIRICEMAATGLYQIDDLLKEAHNIGLTSRKDKPISKQTLIDMLQRRANTGVFHYSETGEWHQGTYEPLISVELYDKIQIGMGWVKTRNSEKPHTTTGRYYQYKGLFLCKTCKFNVTAYTKPKKLASGKEAEYVFYTCTKKSKKVKCKEPQLSDILLEQEIKARMEEFEITESDGVECNSWLNVHYNDYIKKQHKYKPEWLKDQREAQKALEVLDEKLEKGVMTDERYKERAAKHTETLARTKQLLSSANTNAERWLELAKETFNSVTNVGDVFEMANDEERRRLMMYLGSNWYLTNKKVALTPREPLSLLRHNNSETIWRARPDLNRRSPP